MNVIKSKNKRHWPSWNNLKRSLNWKNVNFLGCCGSSKWVMDTNIGEEPLMLPEHQSPEFSEQIIINQLQPECDDHNDSPMNLATALAADRRKPDVGPTDGMMIKPLKSLVRLCEEIEVGDFKVVTEDGGRGIIGKMCCLCTERSKGAALIPCGHTYCKVCARAMWLNQGSCHLCNRLITEILEIF